ncbi:MAG: hypothetical protein GC153_11450 [Alphaproteobacteria bacterium]|nr:hypothetical protein [Alphaproteobacteria bacterium]
MKRSYRKFPADLQKARIFPPPKKHFALGGLLCGIFSARFIWLWLPIAVMAAAPFTPTARTHWRFAIDGAALVLLCPIIIAAQII